MSTSSPLDLNVLPDRASVHVRPSGEIDLANCDLLDARIGELWELGWDDVVVDLRGVTFLDSSGLRVLVKHHRLAAGGDRRFSIIDGTPAISRVLTLTGLDQVLAFAEADGAP